MSMNTFYPFPKSRKVKLGKWQIKCLEMIVKHQACCSHSLIAMIIGSAKKWNMKYRRSLDNAINAHNSGRATNSPLPSYIKIKEIAAGNKLSFGVHAGFLIEDLSI